MPNRRPCQLAQWNKRRSAERETVGPNPGRTNTQGLGEEKVAAFVITSVNGWTF